MTTVGTGKIVAVGMAVDTPLILAVCLDKEPFGANAHGLEVRDKTGTEEQGSVEALKFSGGSTSGNDNVFAGRELPETTAGEIRALVQRGNAEPDVRSWLSCDRVRPSTNTGDHVGDGGLRRVKLQAGAKTFAGSSLKDVTRMGIVPGQ